MWESFDDLISIFFKYLKDNQLVNNFSSIIKKVYENLFSYRRSIIYSIIYETTTYRLTIYLKFSIHKMSTLRSSFVIAI